MENSTNDQMKKIWSKEITILKDINNLRVQDFNINFIFWKIY